MSSSLQARSKASGRARAFSLVPLSFRDAIEYTRGLPITIVLIDRPQLAQLMLDHGVGVSVQETIRLLKIDEDYFEEE